MTIADVLDDKMEKLDLLRGMKEDKFRIYRIVELPEMHNHLALKVYNMLISKKDLRRVRIKTPYLDKWVSIPEEKATKFNNAYLFICRDVSHQEVKKNDVPEDLV